MENTIAVVSDPLFLEHRAPEGHPERPERLAAAERALLAISQDHQTSTTIRRLPARDATGDELGRVHTETYLDALTRIRGRDGYLDGDTYFTPLSSEAALRAAGGCVAMVDSLLDGAATTGLALVRPPGHHARPDTAMGFCLLNNIAVAAAHARARGAARVAIVDWDVHHGNGTQEIFYRDPSVLFISLHQFPFYPGTGSTEEVGTGDGTGATINVPLSAGAGDATYIAAFDRIVAPALSRFDPDLVLVSAGFDAHVRDPLASMRVTEAGYAGMLGRILSAMPRGHRGRLGIVLEGGYDLAGLEGALRATLPALEGPAAPAPEPARDTIDPEHEADLARALRAAKRHHADL
jgi:acetoin utilization deacetylase AcuC-like enzyme